MRYVPFLPATIKKLSSQPEDDLAEVYLGPRHVMKIGAMLLPECKHDLIVLLREYGDVFAWAPSDMLGIDPKQITHYLVVNPKPSRWLMGDDQ